MRSEGSTPTQKVYLRPSILDVGVNWEENLMIVEFTSGIQMLQLSTKEMLEMSNIILALSGPRACGSTIAKHLVNNHGYARLAFADTL